MKAILFDLDDTLVRTYDIFFSYMQHISKDIAREHNIKVKTVFESLRRYNAESYNLVSVNPEKKWTWVMSQLSKEFSFSSKKKDQYYNYILGIYTSTPKLHKGVRKTLKILKNKGYGLGIVSHSRPEWVDVKLEKTKLKLFFDYITTVPVDEYKTSIHWQIAVKKTGLDLKNIIVVGDNLKGDIIAATEIGIEKTFWLDKSYMWRISRDGELPKGCIKIIEIPELLNYL